MKQSMYEFFPQAAYAHYAGLSENFMKTVFRNSLENGESTRIDNIINENDWADWRDAPMLQLSKAQIDERRKYARKSMKALMHFAKAGVTSALGYNFYDLRPPVLFQFPVNAPFREMLPRIGKVNAGVGTSAHWKGTTNPGIPYAGVSEGNRAPIGTPNEVDYISLYKEIGVERNLTFTAEFAGEGFTDNMADERLRGLYALWLQEEALDLFGNTGPGNVLNGFALGQCPTPTVALSTIASAGVGSYTIPNSTYVSVSCVLITAMGYGSSGQYGYLGGYANSPTPTVVTGLTPQYLRTNADGSQDTINGGISQISNMSAVVETTSGTPVVVATVAGAANGAFYYAWFVDVTDTSAPSPANAYLYAITPIPSVVINALPTGTQTGAATFTNPTASFATDYSMQNLDYTGLFSWCISSGGTINNLAGKSLTSNKDGSVQDIENILYTIFQGYQASVSDIWCSPDAVLNLDRAVRYGGSTGGNAGYQIVYTRDSQNNILASSVISAYQSRWAVNNPQGGIAIPIKVHPMLPYGTIFFDVKDNPYPATSRAPYVRGILLQRDYYGIEWPLRTRKYEWGTYAHQTLAHNFPWLSAYLTGIGTFVGN